MSGDREAFGLETNEPDEIDFLDVKGAVESLLSRLGGDAATFDAVEHPTLHPGRAAAITLDGVQIGDRR